MTVKAKRFRIGVEGATTDGREIQREWLVQMAASYNPTVYTALINLEHIKSYLPESTFNRYGRVTGLVAEEIQDGPLAGKMALYADIEPTDALVELVKKGQKLFTSMEVSTKFADTGKAYLVGLGATDDPASLGTEMLAFSASAAHNPLANRKQNPENLFSEAVETLIELEEAQDEKPSLFASVTALFTKKEQTDDARFSDVHKAVELVATEQQNLSERTDKSLAENGERLSALESSLQEQQTAFAELQQQLSREDAPDHVMGSKTAEDGTTTAEPVKVGPGGKYVNLDAVVMDTVNELIDVEYQDDDELVVVCGRELLSDKYFPLVNKEQDNSEKIAADLIISQKRMGGLQAVRAPFFPANALLITRLDNLSIYWQEDTRRRSVIDNPKRDRIENFESVNEAYVVEDYRCAALVENIEIGDFSAPAAPESGE
ncbi:GPO family capsid scaffolding protein [Salmonella enterica subsp. enterica]|nr:GPO family capsid scaffolding protein [Salmonella enterica subsp. enterica]